VAGHEFEDKKTGLTFLYKFSQRKLVEELDLLSRVLAFRALERDIVIKYEKASLDEKKSRILGAWHKIKLRITKDCLEIEEGPPVQELNRIIKSLHVYSTIYADLVNPEALRLHETLERFKKNRKLPRLAEKCKEIVHKEVFGHRKAPEKVIECKHYSKQVLEIDPSIYDKVRDYFIRRVGEEIPSLMISGEVSKITREVVESYIKKILEVAFRNACRSAAYGYIKEDAKEIYDAVLRDSKESIDWIIKEGFLEEKIFPKIKKT